MMRFSALLIPAVLTLTPALHAQDAPAPAPAPAPGMGEEGADLTSDAQKAGYAIGLDIGSNLKNQAVPVDVDALVQGLRDAMAGVEPRLSREQMQAAITTLQRTMMASRDQAGQKFREEFARKEGVKTTASGLMYEVIEEGRGESPKATDTVTVHYTGQTIDGTVFDSSVQRGEPATFALNRVIPGWTEGVQLMKEGAKYRFVIPPDLAYGEQGAPPRIGPNSTLIFDVELIDVQQQNP